MSEDDIYDRYQRVCEARDVAEAKLYLVSDALARLISFVDRIGGYTEPDDQASIRLARIALAEVQR